jgi:hypothetical protein
MSRALIIRGAVSAALFVSSPCVAQDAPAGSIGQAGEAGAPSEPPCDRVCKLERKNAALERYVQSLRNSLAARDAYIEALKKEVARLAADGQ